MTGHVNVPDGELYTAPVRNSVNGTWYVDLPCTWKGVTYQDIRLKFKDGKVVKAAANHPSNSIRCLISTKGLAI